MTITFNGNVTINGNVEMFDNGSMKISSPTRLIIDISQLKEFVETNLQYSENKDNYLRAIEELQKESPTEDGIKGIVPYIRRIAPEIGKGVLITGLSAAVQTIITRLLTGTS